MFLLINGNPFGCSSRLTVFFWAMMLTSGIFGFAISYLTSWQIQVTSPLTHNISGTGKAAAQTVLASVISHDLKSVVWWVGNLFVIVGSLAYTYVRHKISSKETTTLPKYKDDSKNELLLSDENSK